MTAHASQVSQGSAMVRLLLIVVLVGLFIIVGRVGVRRGWFSFGPEVSREHRACESACGARGVTKALVEVDVRGAERGYSCECGGKP